MRETAFDVWVVECENYQLPHVKHYSALRLNKESVTVLDHGRTVVVKAAAWRKWFADKTELKAHLREVATKLKATLEAELAKVTEALAGDQFPYWTVPAERPALWNQPLRTN